MLEQYCVERKSFSQPTPSESMASGYVFPTSVILVFFILFYPINVFNRGPNLYLLTSLIQRDVVSDCYFPRSLVNSFCTSPSPPAGGHIGLSPRSFFGSRIARYTSSSSTATFQLLRTSSVQKMLLSGDIELNPGPTCNQEDQLLDLLSPLRDNRNCSITVGHSNVRGLYCNLNQIRFLLKYSKLDVFAITETHLNESIDNSELFIDGYCLWRLDRRDKKGGGVAVYVKRNIDCEIVFKYKREDIEALWLEVKARSQRLLVGCVYRPPGYDGFFGHFNSTLECIWRTRKNVLITGDFNANLLLNSDIYGKKIRQIMNYYSYTNLIKKPTHTTETTNTLLDLILVSDSSKVRDADVLDFNIADHKFIYAVYNLTSKKQKSFKITNLDQLKKDIEDFPWWICSTFEDINDTTWAWDHSFKNIVNSHVPLREVKIKQDSLPWVNRDIRREMNTRFKLLKSFKGPQSSSHLWNKYKESRNKVTYLLRKAETEYWREKFCESKNSKEFWKTVKDCTNINIIKKSSVVRTLKNNNNTEISDDIDKANFINSYFTSIGENLSQKQSIPDDFDVLNHIYRISPTTHSTEISITQIAKDLEKVKAKKAPGPDGISSKVLSLIKSSAADGLFTVFHKSSTLNKFPDIWKQAKIIPVYKKGS